MIQLITFLFLQFYQLFVNSLRKINSFLNFEDLYAYLDKLPKGILKKDKYGNHGINGQYLCNLSGEVFQKKKSTFVSKVHPLYSQKSVSIVHDIYENHKDRYQFFLEYLSNNTDVDWKK